MSIKETRVPNFNEEVITDEEKNKEGGNDSAEESVEETPETESLEKREKGLRKKIAEIKEEREKNKKGRKEEREIQEGEEILDKKEALQGIETISEDIMNKMKHGMTTKDDYIFGKRGDDRKVDATKLFNSICKSIDKMVNIAKINGLRKEGRVIFKDMRSKVDETLYLDVQNELEHKGPDMKNAYLKSFYDFDNITTDIKKYLDYGIREVKH